MSLAAEIEARERAVWQALVEGDTAAELAELSEDFLGVYSDGFAGIEDKGGQFSAGLSAMAFALSDIGVRPLGPDHALIAYTATYRRRGSDIDEKMYVSSIWRREATTWVNIFSQDTPAAP